MMIYYEEEEVLVIQMREATIIYYSQLPIANPILKMGGILLCRGWIIYYSNIERFG